MAGTITRVDAGAQKVLREKPFNAALLTLLICYLTVWAYTRAHFLADTNVYAEAILRHQHGWDSSDYGSLGSNPFWDFGHVLWRPFGWLCFVASEPVTRFFTHHNQWAEVIFTLVGINFVAALACLSFFFLLVRRVIENDWLAVFVTLGFFSADAFLNYAHSGSAYNAGLACLVAGMSLSLSERLPVPLGFTLGAGVMFALAVLFWLPYIFVLPAAMAVPVFVHGSDRRRICSVVHTLIVCAIVGLGVYVSTIAAAGVRDVPSLREWVLASGHGQVQPGGLRAAARLAFSIPRSFINMDRDGMWLKRYLVHDPYSPVRTQDLFRLSLWKPGLFYTCMFAICFELMRSKRGRSLFLLVILASLPILVFAVFIFEAGSIERYLPLYPFIFLACGYVLTLRQTKLSSKFLLVVALIVTAGVDIHAVSRRRLEAGKALAIARIRNLVPILRPNDTVMALNEQDSLAEFRLNYPLDPINLDHEWQTYDVLELNTARVATWRGDFAQRVLVTWQAGGKVWLPQRFFQPKPNPEWNWVEGDDKRVLWTDLPSYFSRFETGTVVDGQDGFVLLRASAQNKQILRQESHRPAD